MKSLFQGIRSGTITKPACEAQLAQFKVNRLTLTRTFAAQQMGRDLYGKKLAEVNFCIEVVQSILDKWDDLILPLKNRVVQGEATADHLRMPLKVIKAVKPEPIVEAIDENNWTNEGGDYGG